MSRNFVVASAHYISKAHNQSIDGFSAFSMTAWVRRTANVDSNGYICCKRDPGVGEKNFRFGGDVAGSSLRLEVFKSGGNASANSTANTLVANTWYFVAGTFAGGGTDAPILYIGTPGTLCTEPIYASTPTAGGGSIGADTNGPFFAGASNTTPTRLWDGDIADIRYFNVALTLGEVQSIQCGALVRPGAMRLWWPFFGSQSPEPDFSGNGNMGTLSGSPTKTDMPPSFSSLWTGRPKRVIRLNAASSTTHEGAASIAATGTVVPAGVAVFVGAATLAATTSLTPAGVAVYGGAAAPAATSTVTPAPVAIYAAAAVIASTATVVADGSLVGTIQEGAAVISCHSTVAALATVPAFRDVVAVAGASSKTSSNALVITLGSTGMAQGAAAFVAIACDNIQTGDVEDGLDISSVTDSRGNTYLRAKTFTNGNTLAATGATVGVYYSVLNYTLITGDTITVQFSNNITAKAATVGRCIVNHTSMAVEVVLFAADDNSGDLTLLPISGIPFDDYLFFFATAHEGSNIDALDMNDLGYEMLPSAGTTGGTNTSNMSVRAAMKVSPNTTFETVGATYTAADHATVLVAFRAVGVEVNGAASISSTGTVTAAGHVVLAGAATIQAVSSVTATAVVGTEAILQGQAAVQATSTVAAIAYVTYGGTATIAILSDLTAIGVLETETVYRHRTPPSTSYRRREIFQPTAIDDGLGILGLIAVELSTDTPAPQYRHRDAPNTTYRKRRGG